MGIKHLPAIDGLRAIAVLSVVAYHAGAPAGFVGVDVFFVISGYLITGILLDRPALVEFYARRARRILPAAFLCVLVTLALSFALLPSAGDVARSAASAGLFVANVFFQHATGDYWSDSADTMPLLHLWSLSVEEQFYLLWPLLLLAGRRWLPWVAGCSLALFAWWSYADPAAAFYQMPARAWELAAGGLVAAFFGNHAKGLQRRAEGDYLVADSLPHGAVDSDARNESAWARFDFLRNPLVRIKATQLTQLAGNHLKSLVIQVHSSAPINGPDILRNLAALVLQHASHIGLSLVLLACLVPMPHWAAAPVAVLGSTFLIASIHAGRSVRVLEARPLVYVGLISYSLYLWHWPLLAIDRATRVGIAPLETRLALIAVAFVLAVLSYRYVETPFRRARTRPGRTVALGVTVAAALSCTAFAIAPADKPVVIQRAAVEYCHPWGKGPAQFQPARCVPNAPKVVLWGDSFTGPWEGYVLRLATEQKMAAVYAVNTSCPAVIGVSLPRDTPRISAYCRSKAEETYAYLKANGADTLLVSAHWARMLRERPDAGSGVIAWAKGLPNVRRIILIGATPEIRDSVEKCQALGISCDIPRRDYEASASATKAMTRELGKLPNVEVWEVGDWMCDADLCRGVRDVPLYQHDNHHISVEAAVRYQRTQPLAR